MNWTLFLLGERGPPEYVKQSRVHMNHMAELQNIYWCPWTLWSAAQGRTIVKVWKMQDLGSAFNVSSINKAEEMQVCCGNKKKQNKVCWKPIPWDNQQSCFENLIIIFQNTLTKSSLAFFLYFKFYQFGKSRLHLPLNFMLIHIPEAQEGFEIMKPNAALDF